MSSKIFPSPEPSGSFDPSGRQVDPQRSRVDAHSDAETLPVAPSLAPSLSEMKIPRPTVAIDRRTVKTSLLAIVIAVVAAGAAQLLTALIGFFTNLFFYGRLSTELVSPGGHGYGLWMPLIPVLGGLIIGVMARYGSPAIRGHGIPEAMERVLQHESRIPPRMTWLKPLSAAISIGTGGPFGAEGPIIATGGAFGSLVGQILRTTALERKTLLAAGAAAGMAATFGSPIAAVLLAVELLLFEFRARSIIPVALAAVTATGIRYAVSGSAPVFPMPQLAQPTLPALAGYVVLGAFLGVVSVGVTRVVYWIEDSFERLPIHWMWWPALGGLAVGVVGLIAPDTLGVGYTNIEHLVDGKLAGQAALWLCAMKFLSWSLSLGSGTSGGTLAPLFTIGGAVGSVTASGLLALIPGIGMDIRIAALVGMAAIFSGASRAFLASVVFAFETTLQPAGILPLLGGCAAAYLVSALMMRNTIMTEKIERRGVRVPAEYAADFLDRIPVREVALRPVVTIPRGWTVREARTWLTTGSSEAQHHGYPVVNEQGTLVGVVTWRDVFDPAASESARIGSVVKRPPVVVFEDHSLREAADHMTREGVGRLPVVSRHNPGQLVGIVTRSDLLAAHQARLQEADHKVRSIRIHNDRSGSVTPR